MSSRIIIITGSNGGLGQALSKSFLEEAPGNHVILCVHSGRASAERLAADFPGRCGLRDLDVTKPGSWKSAVVEVLEKHGRVDVLVNNAGGHRDGLMALMPVDAWESVRAVNLDAVFHGCQAVLPAMISQRGGRIVNIASLSALLAPPGQTNYSAAKAGVVALSQSLAKEVARLNITVNVVCPGFVESGGTAGFGSEERRSALERIPMRRFGRPEEVSAAVRFLASAEAGYITGAVLKVDGGIL